MRIPKKLKAGATEYKVSMMKPGSIRREEPDGRHSDAWGFTSFKDEIMQIEEASEQREATTFMHELVHVIANQYSLEIDERGTDCLAQGLLGIIRRNKLDFLDLT